MNRLKAIAGGQPLRSNDWAFIQDATAETIKSLVIGLKGAAGACIISGLNVTYDSTYVYVSEGVFFDGEALCYVPAASFTIVGGSTDSPDVGTDVLYLTPNTTTGELRTFKDTSTHNVYEYNHYSLGYAASAPSGSILLSALDTIKGILTDYVIAAIPPAPAGVDLMYVKKNFSSDTLDQAQIVVPRPGAGKITKVVSMLAHVAPAAGSHLELGTQNLNVFYGIDVTEVGIGAFPNNFMETTVGMTYDMVPSFGEMYENAYVSIGYSGETAPTSGSAVITIYCIYKVITL